MVAERITPEAVANERVYFDAQDRLIAGEQVVSSAAVNWALRDLAPREWEEIAAYLFALIAREPVKSSPAYSGHRILLGYLATELRSFARSAGEPVGLEADLRAATSKAEEQRILQRIADRDAAAQRHLDEILADSDRRREREDRGRDAAMSDPFEEEPANEEPELAAPPIETDDDLAYL